MQSTCFPPASVPGAGAGCACGRAGNPPPIARARGEASCPDPALVESQMVGTFHKGFLQPASGWSERATGARAGRVSLCRFVAWQEAAKGAFAGMWCLRGMRQTRCLPEAGQSFPLRAGCSRPRGNGGVPEEQEWLVAELVLLVSGLLQTPVSEGAPAFQGQGSKGTGGRNRPSLQTAPF